MGRQKKIGPEAQMLELFLYRRTSISFPLIQWFSTCGLWTSSINGIWKLVRNSCPPLNPDLLNQKLWSLAICYNNPFKWSWCMLKLENDSFNPYVCILSHFNHVLTLCILWTVGCQAPLSMWFSRQEYWSVLPCPPPGDLPDPGIKPTSFVSPALAGGFFTTSTAWEALTSSCLFLNIMTQDKFVIMCWEHYMK